MIDKDYEAFREIVVSDFARLAERAGRYTGMMDGKDRELVFEDALETLYDLYSYDKQSPLRVWDLCLKASVLQRRYWTIWRSGEWRWQTITSVQLVHEAQFK